jgi:2-polyprenyl-3-methyl-5-hydroxy-6-metoxy-1,4-benzoquinol methylase
MSGNDGLAEEWDEGSESWADFVRKGKDYYRDEMNNPATFKIIGNVSGKRVLDLGCGEGCNSRILAGRGAKVTGVDFSEKMIALAKQKEKKDKLGIDYRVSDAAELKGLKSGSFDVVVCLMALMDIERYQDAVSEVARVLKKRGRFLFSITHPCFEFGGLAHGELIGEWKYKDGAARKEASHLEIRHYFGVTEIVNVWDMERLVKSFRTTSFHRTLTDYFQALHKSGFVVTRLVEPKPSAKGVTKHPHLRKHLKIPHSIIIEAVRNEKLVGW